MLVQFYLGSKGTAQDKVICLRTRSKFSHCELVFPSDPELIAKIGIEHLQGKQTDTSSLCFSSSNRDGGTRFKWIDFKPERWEAVEFKEKDLERIEENAVSLLGRPYGWETIMGYIFPFGEHSKTGLICSEALVLALQFDGTLDNKIKPWRVSPGKLYSLLKN